MLTTRRAGCAGFQLVRSTVPDATGATYSTNGVDCFAEFSMTGFRDDGSGDFQTCLFEPVPEGEVRVWPPYGHHMTGVTECSGTITGTTDSAHSNLVGEDASEHIYNFTISVPGTVTFDGCDSGYDLWLRIMSLDLETEYAGCDDCGCLGDSNRAALRDVFLGEGEYVLVVEGYRSRHGEYHIRMQSLATKGHNISCRPLLGHPLDHFGSCQ